MVASEIVVTSSETDADPIDNRVTQNTAVTRDTFGLGWQNEANSLDVDNDKLVAPMDALLIINELNDPQVSGPGGKLPPPPLAGVTVYLDVDGNGFAVALDALLVINFLNLPPNPEGEAAETRIKFDDSADRPFVPVDVGLDSPSLAATSTAIQDRADGPRKVVGGVPSLVATPPLADSDESSSLMDLDRQSRDEYLTLVDWLFAYGDELNRW